ncbi:hypothetical protein SBOR_4713 [Sclerotinia borealis F-4128]|uniref:DUF6590 domain-containing protein n=1 Tax=Sclerotinia borealis (strain F-4128) TaxID=1432307 RepID=W9CGD2_SCLBF|nr:hypothetical protein SBOR_4713 [Sclerotinia borealis F-4128]
MSTSHRKQKRHSRGSNERTSTFSPTPWSEWATEVKTGRPVRYRLDTQGKYEYDYDKERYDTGSGDSEIRRTSQVDMFEPTQDSTQYSASQSYTSDRTVNDLSKRFAQTTLEETSTPTTFNTTTSTAPITRVQTETNLVRTADPNTFAEEFDPILWSEPMGSGGEPTVTATQSVRIGMYGQAHYEKVRRFLIIKENEGHCLCLPIMTYGLQGTNKKGVHAKHHAIIYTDQPTMIQGEKEKGLRKQPIKVIPDASRERLQAASRLNYAKVYTVEHNVKVWFIGKLTKESESHVVTDYNIVCPPIGVGRRAPNREAAPNNTLSFAPGYGSNPGSINSSQPYTVPPAAGISYPGTSFAPNQYQNRAPTYQPSYGQQYAQPQSTTRAPPWSQPRSAYPPQPSSSSSRYGAYGNSPNTYSSYAPWGNDSNGYPLPNPYPGPN